MKSEAVRLAKIQADKELMLAILNNPVIELLAGIVAISLINNGSQSLVESLTGIDVAQTVESAGLVTIIGLQQLGPECFQAIAGTTGAGLAALGKAIPMLAAGA